MPPRTNSSRLLLCGLLCTVFTGGAFAQAPSPSQVTPQSLRPEPSPANRDLVLPSMPGLTPPAGAEKLTIMIGKLVLDGGFDELQGAADDIEKALVGKRVKVSDLYQAASALEQAYTAAGFPLVRIVIPPQHLKDNGPLRIRIVDGFIEEIDTSALNARVRAPVERRLAILIGKRHLRQSDIERAVLIAGEVPGVQLKSTFAAGREPGGSRLVFDGTYKMLSGGVTVDNRFSPSLGGVNISGNAAVNSAFGYGEQIYVSSQSPRDVENFFDDSAMMRMLGAGFVVPLNYDGWTLNGEVATTRTRPPAVIGAPSTLAHFSRLTLRTTYAAVRTRTDSANIVGEYGHADERTEFRDFGKDMRHDRVDVMRIGGDWTHRFDDARTIAINGVLSHGLGGRTQADAAAEKVPLSRQGAEPEFNKLLYEIRYGHPLAPQLQLSATLRAQTSFGDALLLSEQIALDGSDALSAFLPGSLSADQGATARVEIIRSHETKIATYPTSLQPYVFAAAGRGSLQQPTVLERDTLRAGAIGAGLRSTVTGEAHFSDLRLGLEVARQHSDLPTLHDTTRLNVNAAIKF